MTATTDSILGLMQSIKTLSNTILENQEIDPMTATITINEKVQAVKDGQDKTAESGIVRVLVKVHYGRNHFYPANPTAELFLKVQGGKTLTKPTLRVLKDAGYQVQYRYEEPAI